MGGWFGLGLPLLLQPLLQKASTGSLAKIQCMYNFKEYLHRFSIQAGFGVHVPEASHFPLHPEQIILDLSNLRNTLLVTELILDSTGNPSVLTVACVPVWTRTVRRVKFS